MRIQRWTPVFFSVPMAGQCIAVLWATENTLFHSYVAVVTTVALAILLCARRMSLAVKHNRPLWALLLASLAAKGVAFTLLLIDSTHHSEGTLVMVDPSFWFCVAGWFLIAAASFDAATPTVRWASLGDILTSMLSVGLFYVLLRGAIEGPTAADSAVFLTRLFDALDGFVAAIVLLRFLGTRRADERRFFGVVAAFTVTDAIAAAVHNRLVVATDSYLPELLLTLPMVVVGMLLSRRKAIWLRGFRPSLLQRRLSRMVRPFALSLATCFVALATAHVDKTLAIRALVAALTLFAGRNALVVWYHLSAEDQMRVLRRRLQHAAVHDPLTGLLNRRGLFHILQREYDAARHPAGFSIAMIDVDHFKRFNDEYGHQAGDRCLVHVARSLTQIADAVPSCVVSRYGGEEFVLLFPEVTLESALLYVERARIAVALAPPSPLPPDTRITFSAGLVTVEGGRWPPIDELLRQADSAVYAAKAEGRDRSVGAALVTA